MILAKLSFSTPFNPAAVSHKKLSHVQKLPVQCTLFKVTHISLLTFARRLVRRPSSLQACHASRSEEL